MEFTIERPAKELVGHYPAIFKRVCYEIKVQQEVGSYRWEGPEYWSTISCANGPEDVATYQRWLENNQACLEIVLSETEPQITLLNVGIGDNYRVPTFEHMVMAVGLHEPVRLVQELLPKGAELRIALPLTDKLLATAPLKEGYQTFCEEARTAVQQDWLELHAARQSFMERNLREETPELHGEDQHVVQHGPYCGFGYRELETPEKTSLFLFFEKDRCRFGFGKPYQVEWPDIEWTDLQ